MGHMQLRVKNSSIFVDLSCWVHGVVKTQLQFDGLSKYAVKT